MDFTHSRYQIPYGCLENPKTYRERPEYIFLPDQILDRLKSSIPWMRDYFRSTDKKMHAIYGVEVAGPNPTYAYNWSMSTPKMPISKAEGDLLVSRVLGELNPSFEGYFLDAVRHGWIEIGGVPEDVAWAGCCDWLTVYPDGRPATIYIYVSPNQITYLPVLAHEAGHYVSAAHCGQIREDYISTSASLVSEIQALFCELHFLYSDGFKKIFNDRESYDHFVDLTIYNKLDRYYMVFEYLEETSYRIDANPAIGYEGANKTYSLCHRLNYACALFIAAGYLERWKSADQAGQAKILDAIYPRQFPKGLTINADCLKRLFNQTDIYTETALTVLFNEGASRIMGDAELITIFPSRSRSKI